MSLSTGAGSFTEARFGREEEPNRMKRMRKSVIIPFYIHCGAVYHMPFVTVQKNSVAPCHLQLHAKDLICQKLHTLWSVLKKITDRRLAKGARPLAQGCGTVVRKRTPHSAQVYVSNSSLTQQAVHGPWVPTPVFCFVFRRCIYAVHHTSSCGSFCVHRIKVFKRIINSETKQKLHNELKTLLSLYGLCVLLFTAL